MKRLSLRALLFASSFIAFGGSALADTSVTTYHNDNYRTGWNPNETILTSTNVNSDTFKLVKSVKLDDQVDAQPLVVASQATTGHTARDVVYVATESNTVYAIDAATGKILLQTNLGAPVPQDNLPGGCNNNGPNVGIDSTPVIDPTQGVIYVIADVLKNNNAKFQIHALSLTTLQDTVTPMSVSGTGKLSNGHNYHFNANVSRQRPALLLSKGNLYAGFGSYCDVSADESRGWVLGWTASTLKPLAANELTNALGTSSDNYFLTSIWMSGYGLAGDANGNVLFVTGNSDPSGDSLNVKNITESAASVSSDLSIVNSVFTAHDWASLDRTDGDFGSGGLLLVPPQKNTPNLVAAAGKDGNLYLLNAGDLGRKYASYQIGGCWCGQSYFTGADGAGRIVTSGGSNVGIWEIKGGSKPKLVQTHQASSGVNNGQLPGFFTSVSSSASKKPTIVIWAVGRPTDSDAAKIQLYAYNRNANLLFSADAGSWHNTGGDANIVPTVANGHVYVASDKTLAIFGLSSAAVASLPVIAEKPYQPKLMPGVHEVYGFIRAVQGSTITIETRAGHKLTVDGAEAVRDFNYAQPDVGRALMARGTYEPSGVMRATYVFHAKQSSKVWLPDR